MIEFDEEFADQGALIIASARWPIIGTGKATEPRKMVQARDTAQEQLSSLLRLAKI